MANRETQMNIVFDLGNVLLRWDPRFLYRKLFTDEARMEWFLAHVCSPEWNLEQDRGRSFAEAVNETSKHYPDYAGEIAAFDLRWHETLSGPIEGTVEIIDELESAGTHLYAITNWNSEKFRETRQRYPILERFRDIVVSGDEGMVKPDPAIFQLFLKRNGLPAAECLFIDDNAHNVAGAEAVGMRAHHFTTPEILRQRLVTMGLL
jgi:2-haloacid dehalogenase